MLKYYTALIAFSVLTMLMLMVMAINNDALSRRLKSGIFVTSLLIMIAALCEYLGVVLSGGPARLRTFHMIVKFLELSLAPAIPVLYANAIKPVKSTWYLALPLGLHTLLEFSSMWLGITFYVDANNVYTHCSLYGVYYATYFLGTVFLIVQIARFTRRLQNQNAFELTIIMCFVLLGILWQVLDSSMKVVWLAIAIGDVMFYIYYCDILHQTDHLTHLLNRRNYDIRMMQEHRTVVIIMADVDTFKTVNDQYGHQFGDACLVQIGAALKEAYGKYGLCYRIGGDEFCVVLHKAMDTIERMNAMFFSIMEAKRRIEPRLPHVSVGYALFDPGSMTLDAAAEKADQMMYIFKQKAKDGSTQSMEVAP